MALRPKINSFMAHVFLKRNVIAFRRSLTTEATGTVFNKRLRIHHLDRSSQDRDAHVFDYIRDHTAKDLCDRIDLLANSGRKVILNIGSCSGLISKNLNPDRVQLLIQADISRESVKRARRLDLMLTPKFPIEYLQSDEEFLPIRQNTVDLVLSCLDLHWVNDLLGCFKQVRQILKNNSAFVGCLLGGDTLFELRSSFQLAELERLSGFSPHVAPKTTGQDIARLLQASGFGMVTVDISEVKINYPSIFELMFDLQGMGENNASIFGSRHLHREVLVASAAAYQHLYGSNVLEQGIPATFQIIHFIGWKSINKPSHIKQS